jgi:hypothetical protein
METTEYRKTRDERSSEQLRKSRGMIAASASIDDRGGVVLSAEAHV